jgi:hypothetical protein
MTDDILNNPPAKELSPQALRALKEAAERRAAQDQREEDLKAVSEVNGRKGPEPVRYQDWEVKGIATDF